MYLLLNLIFALSLCNMGDGRFKINLILIFIPADPSPVPHSVSASLFMYLSSSFPLTVCTGNNVAIIAFSSLDRSFLVLFLICQTQVKATYSKPETVINNTKGPTSLLYGSMVLTAFCTLSNGSIPFRLSHPEPGLTILSLGHSA